jgi:hypothetical protein
VRDAWTTAAWLSSPSVNVAKYVAEALLGGARPADELAAMRALGAATASEAALAERLRVGGLTELLAKAVLPELQRLVVAGEATGVELHGKVIAARFEPQPSTFTSGSPARRRVRSSLRRLGVRIPLAPSLYKRARGSQ